MNLCTRSSGVKQMSASVMAPRYCSSGTRLSSSVTLFYSQGMSQFIIYFNQQWVGEHSEEWFAARGPLANAVVSEMRDAGVLVFAAGVEEDTDAALVADATSGTTTITPGLYAPTEQYIGGFTVIDVADDADAQAWGAKLAEACGWPQQIRRVY